MTHSSYVNHQTYTTVTMAYNLYGAWSDDTRVRVTLEDGTRAHVYLEDLNDGELLTELSMGKPQMLEQLHLFSILEPE